MYPEDDQQLVDGDQENLTEIFDNKSIELQESLGLKTYMMNTFYITEAQLFANH